MTPKKININKARTIFIKLCSSAGADSEGRKQIYTSFKNLLLIRRCISKMQFNSKNWNYEHFVRGLKK